MRHFLKRLAGMAAAAAVQWGLREVAPSYKPKPRKYSTMKSYLSILLAAALFAPILPAAPKEKEAVPCVAIDLDKLDEEGPLDVLRIWGKTSKVWPAKEAAALKVRFLDGSTSQQAKAWARFVDIDRLCGVNFIRVTSGNSHIRVSFRQQGHWSYVGTDNKSIQQNAATMSLQLSAWAPDSEYNRVAVHEMLHALGFEHEHQHPQGGIPWDVPKVVAYYGRTQGWSPSQVQSQVLNRYTGSNWRGTAPDLTSIMHYPVEQSLTVGNFSVPWNTKMSLLDISFLQKTYPQPRS
jgi:hypothetical protein